jgi:mono/diheme cytochrome c family protein
MSAAALVLRATVGGALSLFTACAIAGVGATDRDLARGRDETSLGARLFTSECARCHGLHGEGIADGPAILGPRALPEYAREATKSGIPGVYDPQDQQIESQIHRTGMPVREPLHNAQDLYAFLSTHLPKSRILEIQPEGLLTVVTFIMAVQGADLPRGGLTFDSASTVAIPRR